jgi:hypothetical protein
MLQRFVDAAAVAAEIERLRSLSGAALRRRWQAEFGRPASRSLTVDLLRRMIANRIQEEAFGTLDRATLKLLDGLARRDGARRRERNLKIGTVLVRDYQGRRHTVTFSPDRKSSDRNGLEWWRLGDFVATVRLHDMTHRAPLPRQPFSRSSASRTVSKCADLNKPETAMASFAGLVRLAALR